MASTSSGHEDGALHLTAAKIDVDAEPALATRFGVTGLPALLFLKGDPVVERLVGAVPKPILLKRLQALLG